VAIPAEILRSQEIEIHRGPRACGRKEFVISWDYHQVLNKFRESAKRWEDCSYQSLPWKVIEQLERVERFADVAQIVTSFCHIQDTKDNVTWYCCNQAQFSSAISQLHIMCLYLSSQKHS